jgi:hypothetical protein
MKQYINAQLMFLTTKANRKSNTKCRFLFRPKSKMRAVCFRQILMAEYQEMNPYIPTPMLEFKAVQAEALRKHHFHRHCRILNSAGGYLLCS